DALEFGGVLIVGVFLGRKFFGIGVIARVDADDFNPFDGFHGRFGFEMDIGHDGNEATAFAKVFDNVLEVGGVLDGGGGDADELAADGDEFKRLFDAFGGVHRIAGEHGLCDDGMIAADNNA